VLRYAQDGFVERIPYQPLEPSMLKEEAKYLADKLRKQAAGRPFEMMHLDVYYEEKQRELEALKPKI
jgi:hypothetical protein